MSRRVEIKEVLKFSKYRSFEGASAKLRAKTFYEAIARLVQYSVVAYGGRLPRLGPRASH